MKQKIFVLVLIALVIGAFYAFDLGRFFSLEYVQQQRALFIDWYQQNPALVLGGFFIAYLLVAGLSIPGAGVMTVAAGGLFGFWTGLILVSFASSLGALLAFAIVRFLAREPVQKRFASQLEKINQGVEQDGAFYLFSIRLVPAFPFFLVNILMALTPMRPWTFYWVSQLGMLAGTAVYVNAGTRLGELESLSGILDPQLIGAFLLLAAFPWIARTALGYFRREK